MCGLRIFTYEGHRLAQSIFPSNTDLIEYKDAYSFLLLIEQQSKIFRK
jgi:hypothetical protein